MLLMRNKCHLLTEVSSETSALHDTASREITVSNQSSHKNFQVVRNSTWFVINKKININIAVNNFISSWNISVIKSSIMHLANENYVQYFEFYISVFIGLVVSMLASGTKVRGFKPGWSRRIFRAKKNPQHAFLRRGSKHVYPMS
jgi:hypothetical protein